MAKRLELSTPAKINLFLRITGRRPDGYHELDSLFLPISLFDRIVVEIAPAAASSVSIRCNWADMPLDSRNLAVRAAQLFLTEAGVSARVEIDLTRRSPRGRGWAAAPAMPVRCSERWRCCIDLTPRSLAALP